MVQKANDLLTPQSVGERVMLLRRRRNLSQSELAQRMTELGVSTQNGAVSKIETNLRAPTLLQLLAIARALEVAPEELGVRREDYAEATFLRDGETLALLERFVHSLHRRRDLRHLRSVPSPSD